MPTPGLGEVRGSATALRLVQAEPSPKAAEPAGPPVLSSYSHPSAAFRFPEGWCSIGIWWCEGTGVSSMAQADLMTPGPTATAGSRACSYLLHKTQSDSLFLVLWELGQVVKELSGWDSLKKKKRKRDVWRTAPI